MEARTAKTMYARWISALSAKSLGVALLDHSVVARMIWPAAPASKDANGGTNKRGWCDSKRWAGLGGAFVPA